jgi:regulator of PEP synthase PpsR (kinase-PPPase family)
MHMDHPRPVFYVSDGTGITAETIGHSMLTQFSGMRFQTDRLPFVDTPEKARLVAARIRAAGEASGLRPIVVNSSVDPGLSTVLAESGALMLDVFAPFLEPLERELGQARQARVGQAHGMVDFEAYHRRINAMNYALTHDDGARHRLRRGRPDPGRGLARGQDAHLRVPGAAPRGPCRQLPADRRTTWRTNACRPSCAQYRASCSA